MTIATKTCHRCQTEKPAADFYFRNGKPSGNCRSCVQAIGRAYHAENRDALRLKMRERYKARKEKNPSFITEQYLKVRAKRFNLSLDVARKIWQTNTCFICGVGPKQGKGYLVFDHSHQTEKFRGLLCNCCNWMLGQAKDDSAILRKGAEYLEAM